VDWTLLGPGSFAPELKGVLPGRKNDKRHKKTELPEPEPKGHCNAITAEEKGFFLGEDADNDEKRRGKDLKCSGI